MVNKPRNLILTIQDGFTLIELMIVIAILGIISSAALVAYSTYIETTQAQVMASNFQLALNTARNNYVAARQLRAIGVPPSNAIPSDSGAWVDLLNSTNGMAPSGGVAYVTGAGSSLTGAIGLQFNGSYAGRDSEVIVTRPAYSGLPLSSVAISQVNY